MYAHVRKFTGLLVALLYLDTNISCVHHYHTVATSIIAYFTLLVTLAVAACVCHTCTYVQLVIKIRSHFLFLIKVSSIERMKISEVNMIFHDLIDYLYLYLSATVKLPFNVEKYRCINPLFTKQWLRKLKSLYLFKIYLLPFMTWLDHSILKDLVTASGSEDAEHLLNLFDSKLCSYSNQPIVSFPVLSPCQLMIPLDDSEYTLLAMELCVTSQDNITQSIIVLQDVMDIKLKLKCQWQINSSDIYSFQLVAVNIKLMFLYWMIPKRLVKEINNNMIHEWRSGIIKMTIPANLNNDGGIVNKGPFSSLSFLCQDDAKVGILHIYISSVICL